MEDRLKKFAHLVDAGSFTKAACDLHISQPALSTAITKLERELKARLLVRGSRPLALTPAGKLAYQAAKDLAVHTDNLRLRLAELANQFVTLRIGMIDSIADTLFSGEASLDLLEGAKVSVVVNNSRVLAEAVERGDLDVAFVARQINGKLPSILEARHVGTEPLVVVCHADRHVDPKATTLPDFIAYDQASNTFQLVQNALKKYGLSAEITIYSTSPEIMLRLVLQNRGIAALPYLMVKDHLASGKLRRLGNPEPWLIPRKILVLKRRDRLLSAGLQQISGQLASTLHILSADAQLLL